LGGLFELMIEGGRPALSAAMFCQAAKETARDQRFAVQSAIAWRLKPVHLADLLTM